MATCEEAQPGVVLEHTRSGHRYLIVAHGHVRLRDGTWTPAARYHRHVEVTAALPEYYRPLADFGSFTLVSQSSQPARVANEPIADAVRLRTIAEFVPMSLEQRDALLRVAQRLETGFYTI